MESYSATVWTIYSSNIFRNWFSNSCYVLPIWKLEAEASDRTANGAFVKLEVKAFHVHVCKNVLVLNKSSTSDDISKICVTVKSRNEMTFEPVMTSTDKYIFFLITSQKLGDDGINTHHLHLKAGWCKCFRYICKYYPVMSGVGKNGISQRNDKLLRPPHVYLNPPKNGLTLLRDHSIEGKSANSPFVGADTDGVPGMNNPGMSLAMLSQILYQQAVSGPSIVSSNAHSPFYLHLQDDS